MITISVLGLDQFVVGRYSREHAENLVQAFGCDPDELNFYAPNAMIFHEGVEQTSWNILVVVSADEKYESRQDVVAQYLMHTLKDFTVHMEIRFDYFNGDRLYKLINDEYPPYLTERNIVKTDSPYEDEDYDSENPDEEESLYLGDVFAGMEEKLDAANNPDDFKK